LGAPNPSRVSLPTKLLDVRRTAKWDAVFVFFVPQGDVVPIPRAL